MAPISFARGAPVARRASTRRSSRTARGRARARRQDDPLVRDGRRLRPAARACSGERHGVDPARVFVTTGGLQGFVFYSAVQLARRPGPGARRGADLRPAAEAPPLAGRRDRGDPDGRRRARPGRARGGARAAAARSRSSTRFRRSRTRAAARSASGAGGGSPSSSRAHGLDVLEDDPYGLVRYEGTAPPSLHALEGGERVTFTSSFSKTVAPGLRVGWFVVPEALRRRVRRARGVDVHLAAAPPAGDRPRALRAGARSSRTSSVIRGLLAAPARRDARRARRRSSTGARRGAGPRAATSCGSTSRRASTRATCSRARPRRA